MLLRSWSPFVLVALLPACITPQPADDGKETGDTDETGDSNGGTDGPTIFEVNNGTISVGELITLERVVISSPRTYGDEGIFIQDPAGGANSGLYVWSYNGVAGLYVEPGDEVSVTGSVTDYYGWLEFSIDSTDDVVVTGSADVPAPEDLGDGSGVDWDSYESVPVTLTGQTVTAINEYGTATLDPSGVLLDNGFVNTDASCRGTFDTVTGIIFYQYEEWSLNPRTEDEVGEQVEGERLDVTAAEVQRDGVCGAVQLTGLVVTSPVWEYDKNSYFFAQDEGGGEYSGIVVYLDDETVSVDVGDVVDLVGETTEFYGLTEVRVDAPEDVVVVGSAEPTVDVLSSAAADWEPWESCLVQVGPLAQTCEDPADHYGECLTDWNISLDTLFYDYPWAEGVGYDEVTGLVYYSYSTWYVEPRDAADVVQE